MQLVNNVPISRLTDKYGLSSSAINRHKYNGHITKSLAVAAVNEPTIAESLPAGIVLMNQIKDMRETALSMLNEAGDEELSARDKIAVLKEIREQIKLMADIMLKSLELDTQKKQDQIVVRLHWD